MGSRFPGGIANTQVPISDGNVLQSAPIEDPALQARMQPWVDMECYQLDHGRTVAQMDTLNLGGQQIVRERQAVPVHKLGHAPVDFCTVSICTPDPHFRFSEHCGEQADMVFFMSGNVEFDIHVPAGGETAYVGFSQEEFLRGARALNPILWEHQPQGVVPLACGKSGEFKEIVDLWFVTAQEANLRGEALDLTVLRGQMLQAVLQISAGTEDGEMPSFNEKMRALRIGRAARAFVDDRRDADVLPTVVDICVALGVSERTLRYAFQEYVGLSPLVYLRACRLNRVRAALTASEPQEVTVTQIAMRHGFVHLGRFSGDYRRMFGVTPSETLNR